MGASRRTQIELEAPAKVYQLDALDTKIDGIINQLGIIERQTANTVTVAQMEERLKEYEVDMKEHVANEVKLIHSEYKPIKNGAWIVVSAVVLGIVAQVVLNILNLGGR